MKPLFKKALASLIALLVIIACNTETSGSGTVSAAPAAQPVLLKINNYYVAYTAPKAPYVDAQNRIMIPLRSVSELLGARVSYDTDSKTASITLNGQTVTFTIGSKALIVNGAAASMDTVPAIYENAMFIPLSVLARHLQIENAWDQANHLYTLTGDNFMQSDFIKLGIEDFELGAFTRPPGTITSDNAFRPVSYTYDSANGLFSLKAKNITGADVAEGAADVAVFLLYKDSVQFPNPDRARPVVKKDGTLEVSVQKGTPSDITYVLVKGRLLDRSGS